MFERIRAAWRAFWKSTSAATPASDAVTEVEERRNLTISQAALWEAARHGGRVPDASMVWTPPAALPGVVPASGMAMDSGDFSQLASYAMASGFSEGLGFLGYPYLAELFQRGEYQHICSIWAEHCTRKWIKLSGDKEKAKKIEAEFDRLDLRQVIENAIRKERGFGRIQLFLDFGDFNKPEELSSRLVVAEGKINPDRPLDRIAIVEPMWSYPGVYDAQNPLAPNFYKPETWYVSGRIVHASRLLTMVGHEMPNMLKPVYAFGGVSLTQMCKPYVDNWLRARQSVSDLLHSFSIMVLKTDMNQVLQGGPADTLFKRVDFHIRTRDNRGLQVIDKNSEDFTNVSAPISGIDHLQAQALEQISSISGIPLVILLGITPSGLNASSEGEIRVFYDKILAFNNRVVRPVLETILEVVQLSLFGEIDPEITFEFNPLWEMSDKDKADIRKADAEADVGYVNAGAVDPDEVRERLRNDETSLYHGVNLEGPAPGLPDMTVDLPEDETEDLNGA